VCVVLWDGTGALHVRMVTVHVLLLLSIIVMLLLLLLLMMMVLLILLLLLLLLMLLMLLLLLLMLLLKSSSCSSPKPLVCPRRRRSAPQAGKREHLPRGSKLRADAAAAAAAFSSCYPLQPPATVAVIARVSTVSGREVAGGVTTKRFCYRNTVLFLELIAGAHTPICSWRRARVEGRRETSTVLRGERVIKHPDVLLMTMMMMTTTTTTMQRCDQRDSSL
jgi:hypothetical protein